MVKTKWRSDLPQSTIFSVIVYSTYVAQLLCGLSYKIWSTFITKFGIIELLIVISDISAIIHESPCYYVVTTSEIGLYAIPKKNMLHNLSCLETM